MRAIKVTYRAVFQQLRMSAMKCSAAVNVEVVQSGAGEWFSRSPDTGVEFKFTRQQSAEAAKKEAESRFEIMISDSWWITGKPPDESARRPLEPEELVERDGKMYILEPNDFTHIFDSEASKKPENAAQLSKMDIDHVWPAACGQLPRLRHFVSTKAKVPPTCRQCLEIYQKEYARK